MCSPTRRSGATTTWAAARTVRASRAGGGFGGFGDIFETFFGGGGGQAAGPIRAPSAARTPSSAVSIDLKTAAFGGTVDLDVTTAVVCDTCSGAGTQEGTKIGDV